MTSQPTREGSLEGFGATPHPLLASSEASVKDVRNQAFCLRARNARRNWSLGRKFNGKFRPFFSLNLMVSESVRIDLGLDRVARSSSLSEGDQVVAGRIGAVSTNPRFGYLNLRHSANPDPGNNQLFAC